VNGVPVTPFSSVYVMNNLCPGLYHWVLSDAGLSCIDSGNVAVNNVTALSAIMTFIHVSCHGEMMERLA
jgi:hypothetical protein